MATKRTVKKSKPPKRKALSAKKKERSAKKKSSRAKSKAAKPAKAKTSSKTSGLSPEKRIPDATLIGTVIDYFSHVGVIALKLLKPLAISDTIRIKGHTTDIIQKVGSIEVDHKPIQTAATGDSVGIKIVDRARKGDAVYKI